MVPGCLGGSRHPLTDLEEEPVGPLAMAAQGSPSHATSPSIWRTDPLVPQVCQHDLPSHFPWPFANRVDWPLKRRRKLCSHPHTPHSGYTAHQLRVAEIIQMPRTILNINIHPQLSTTL